jgi:hypothetical protein
LGNPSSLPPLLFLSLFLLILYWRCPYLLFLSPSHFSGPAWEHTALAASGPNAGAQLAHRGTRVAAGLGAGAPEAGWHQRGSWTGGAQCSDARGGPGRAGGRGVRAPARGPSGARRSRRCGRARAGVRDAGAGSARAAPSRSVASDWWSSGSKRIKISHYPARIHILRIWHKGDDHVIVEERHIND